MRRLGLSGGPVPATERRLRFRLRQECGTKGPKKSGRGSTTRKFRPGDTAKESGIYEVIHDRAHRTAHEVVMIAGNEFPTCDTCDVNVRFKLVRTAPYIFQDQDFEEENQ